MSVDTGTFYFSKNDWCESRGYSCCNRVIVSPRNLSYKVGDTIRLRNPGLSCNRVRPDEWFAGAVDLQAQVVAIEHYVSPSQTMLFLGPVTSLNGAPLWMHIDELNYSTIDYTSPCYFPYGYSTPWGLCCTGAGGMDVLAILHSGATAIEFDYVITIDGGGYWGTQTTVKTLYGPGYSMAGSQHINTQQGNVFTGRVSRTGSYKSGYAIYIGITWTAPYPVFSACRFQLSNIKFANCRGELYDAPTYFCINSTVGYLINITKSS